MIRLLLVVACAWLCVGQARADDQLHFGAQPDWVVPVAEPAAKPADGALNLRLVDFQVRFDERGMHQFVHQVLRINTPEGLLAAGTVGLVWQPTLGTATVNRVIIHRGAETIDVMKDGKGFQILRREAGLEALMITGILTAIMPVPDLRVGDEIEYAYTLDVSNPVLLGHVEATMPLTKMPQVDRMSVRYSWPVGRPVRWQEGPLLPKAVLTKANGWQIVTIARDNWETPEIPAGAPGRFANGGLIQAADFADWNAVAGVMRPLFVKASTITPESPVMAEVKRIAAMSTDPKVRASEALRVVQSQVRYLARVDGLGGYTPESADVVWAGKSGDCKGKTVLLLSMLRALGITAEPALVSATEGDGVDASLPMPGRFNHVIVRATIGGKVYWLDGTRLGDRGIDTIAVPGFKWALPLDAAAAPNALTALVATEPAVPETEFRLDLDARDGLDKPARASGSVTYRGEAGSGMRLTLSVASAAKRDEFMRAIWTGRFTGLEIKTVTQNIDDQTGDVSLSFTGTLKMDWDSTGLDSAKRYTADYARLGRDIAPKREKDENSAPVAVGNNYSLSRETILLPDNGKGFEFEGEAFDRVIGGVRYVRKISLTGGKFEMSAASSNKPFEISYAEAKTADKQTDTLAQKQVFIRAPLDFTALAAVPELKAKDADGDKPVDTGFAEISRLAIGGKNEEALKLVDTRIAGGDKSGRTLAMRGQLLGRLSKADEADAAYDQALAADRREPTAIIGKAETLVGKGRLEDALILYDRLVLVWPDAAEAYRRRAGVRFDLDDKVGAMSDLGILIGKAPDDVWARTTRVSLYLEQDKGAEALADARALLALKPKDSAAHNLLGYVLAVQGKKAEAVAELDKSIATEANAGAYDTRLRFGLEADDKARLADLLALIKLDPASAPPGFVLRKLLADPATKIAISAAYDAALADDPDNDDIQTQRALMLAIGGTPLKYVELMDARLAKKPDDAGRLNEACWARAMFGYDLESATKQCDKSIAAERDASTLDSRGLVWLQRGDWAKAASDYDDALARSPRLASSLYGRGLAKKRLGDPVGSKADFAAAARIDPQIADTYATYGLKP